MNLRHVRAIARKEIYHLLRDFRSLYLAFAVPLLLILLFGYALSLDVEKIETVVVDQDRTELSRDFIRRLGASSYFWVTTHLLSPFGSVAQERFHSLNEGPAPFPTLIQPQQIPMSIL